MNHIINKGFTNLSSKRIYTHNYEQSQINFDVFEPPLYSELSMTWIEYGLTGRKKSLSELDSDFDNF